MHSNANANVRQKNVMTPKNNNNKYLESGAKEICKKSARFFKNSTKNCNAEN